MYPSPKVDVFKNYPPVYVTSFNPGIDPALARRKIKEVIEVAEE